MRTKKDNRAYPIRPGALDGRIGQAEEDIMEWLRRQYVLRRPVHDYTNSPYSPAMFPRLR